MRVNRSSLLVLGIGLALPAVTVAQSPFNVDAPANGTTSETPREVRVGGTQALDIVPLRAGRPGNPLRFGNVVPGSERVLLGARELKAGTDYAFDYDAGVIYLRFSPRPGDSLVISYRYLVNPDPAAPKRFAGLPGMRFELVPGGLSMMMGLGMTERTADGAVLSSNVFGFNSGMSLGGGKLSGLFLHSQRERNDVVGGMQLGLNARAGEAENAEGSSTFLVQNYATKMLGGSAEIDYQDIDKEFTSFSAVGAAGFDAAKVNQFRSERGLTRLGVSLNDLKVGGLGLSQSFRNVKDEGGSIEWRKYGVRSGGLSLQFEGRSVDDTFQRFRDIAEQDREQLMRERGMSRQTLSGEFAQKMGKISFNANSVVDDRTGQGITRREASLDTSRVKMSLGDQEVAAGFNRWDSILGQEKATWGLEAGLRRQWMNLESSLLGNAAPIKFNQSLLTGKEGSFRAHDAEVKGNGWSLTHSARGSDKTFASMGAMQDPEVDRHIGAVAGMYGPGIQWRPEDRGLFRNLAGLTREYTAIGAQPFKGWDVELRRMRLDGVEDSGGVDSASVKSPRFSANYRRQELGQQFHEVGSLMEFERQRLGAVAGLERTDFGFNWNLGGSKAVQFTSLAATTADGAVRRTSASFQDKKIEVTVNAREVDSGVRSANQLVDPEKDLLQSLAGFGQRDARIKWEILPNLRMDLFDFQAHNDVSGEDRDFRQVILNWKPDSKTNVDYFKTGHRQKDSLGTLFAHAVERIGVSRDFGRYGKLAILDERQDFDGRNSQLPDIHRQHLAYETNLDRRTSLRTEQTRTRFENGDKEDVSASTVSTSLTRNTGVALTEVQINRNGDERDEKRRNYGFWWVIGQSLRLTYGYARHLNGHANGSMTSTVTLGPNAAPNEADKVSQAGVGEIAGLRMGAGYGVNRWDEADRTQAFSNVTLSTAKPIAFGPVQDLNFSFGYDTAADQAVWARENRAFNVGAKLFGNQVGYEYRSAIHPNGYRGVDRTFRVQTTDRPNAFLVGSAFYKARTLPWEDQVMIRDFNLTARLHPSLSLTHRLRTNPEVMRGDAFLGSVTAADRSNEWVMDWKRSSNFTVSGSWRELMNDSNNSLARTGGITLTFNQAVGSPLSIFYGVEQSGYNEGRRTMHRYHVQFDQRPGPNQVFSIFAGNVSYDHTIVDGRSRNNLTLRMDYQWRF
jgi:hypothetical protein